MKRWQVGIAVGGVVLVVTGVKAAVALRSSSTPATRHRIVGELLVPAGWERLPPGAKPTPHQSLEETARAPWGRRPDR